MKPNTIKPSCSASSDSLRRLPSRRIFLGGLTGGFAALTLPPAARAAQSEPHFFLEIVITGGLDPTYFFDARRLALTAAGLQQNYLGQEPAQWAGSNGGQTLVAAAAEKLRPFHDDLAILNGVVMSTSFDGHDQNLNVLLTGNPFGGNSMLSRLNPDKPLDFLKLGPLEGSELRDSRYVPLRLAAARELQAGLAAAGGAPPAFRAFLETRYGATGAGNGRFSSGARAMLDAERQSRVLEERLQTLKLPDDAGTDEPGDLGADLLLMAEFFRRRVSQAALLDLTGEAEFDVHSKVDARAQAPLYQGAADRLAQILTFLKQTPFDERNSLLDVTTVLFASEFGRTMRQEGQRIDDTGTDHNPLANTVIAAGKGIRGGIVLGGSDFHGADEELSGAHLAFDPKRLKRMGRPIDWNTGLPTEDAPPAYVADKYLSIASVANSIYSLFGVDHALFWESARNAPAAKVLTPLLR